ASTANLPSLSSKRSATQRGCTATAHTASAVAARSASRPTRRERRGSRRSSTKAAAIAPASTSARTIAVAAPPGTASEKDQSLMEPSGPAPSAAHDEGGVDLVVLVVEAERVHDDVHAEADGALALLLAARRHGELPGAEVVARPRAAEIVAA